MGKLQVKLQFSIQNWGKLQVKLQFSIQNLGKVKLEWDCTCIFISSGDFCIGKDKDKKKRKRDGGKYREEEEGEEEEKFICCSQNKSPYKPYYGFGCCGKHPTQTNGEMICVGQDSDVCSEDGCLVGESWLCGPPKNGTNGGCCNDPDLDENDGKVSVCYQYHFSTIY